jgi:hypothetical protein
LERVGDKILQTPRSRLSDSERKRLWKHTRLGVDWIYGAAKEIAEVKPEQPRS